jgi:hypothetical protein
MKLVKQEFTDSRELSQGMEFNIGKDLRGWGKLAIRVVLRKLDWGQWPSRLSGAWKEKNEHYSSRRLPSSWLQFKKNGSLPSWMG